MEASGTFSAGYYNYGYYSESANALDIMNPDALSVHFAGNGYGGTQLCNDFLIHCRIPCFMTQVSISGSVFKMSSAYVYDDAFASNLIESQSISGSGSSYVTHNIAISADMSTDFRLKESSSMVMARYRASVDIEMQCPTDSPTYSPTSMLYICMYLIFCNSDGYKTIILYRYKNVY